MKIDLGPKNWPVIKMHIVVTEDVRDKLARQFIERLDYASNLACVEFIPGETKEAGYDCTDIVIHPIPAESEDKWMEKLCLEQRISLVRSGFSSLNHETKSLLLTELVDMIQIKKV